MTAAVRQLLQSYDGLPAAEQHQATVEILRRTLTDAGNLPEESLLEAADELFRGLYAEEARHAAG